MSRGLAIVRANSTTSIQMNSVNSNHEDKPISAFISNLNSKLSNWHNCNTLRKSSEFVSNKLFLSKSNNNKTCVPHYYSGLRLNSNQKLNIQQTLMSDNNFHKHQMNNSFCSFLNTNGHQPIRRQESWNKSITPHHPSLLTSSKLQKIRQNSLCGTSLMDVSFTNSMLSASSSTKKSSNNTRALTKSVKTVSYQYVNIDIQDKIGMTPLILAAEAGTSGLNIFVALLNAGADLMMKDKMNMSALHYAAYVGALATVRGFFEYSNSKYPQMACNVRKKSHELLNVQDKYGRTPIYLATARGHKEVVNYLISVGADLHIANYEKKSPLYISAYFGHLEIVNTLLRNGAKVDQADSHMKTPLYVATYHGRNDIVDLLLTAGANVNTTDKNGKTPLYIGVLHGNMALANKLLGAGAIINKPDHEGLGPLHMAVKFPKLDIPMIKLLLSYGCDPVNLAAFTRWLITHGIIPEECIQKDEELRTWLHIEESSVKSLKRICRAEIQRALGHIDTMKTKISKLPLPESLQAYVSMKAL